MKRKVLTSMVIGSTGLLAMLGLWYLQPIKFDQAQGTQEKSFVKETANKTETGPEKGPELERWYFKQWHQPFGAVLSPELLHQMRTEASALPDESELHNSPDVTGWQSIGPDRMSVPGSNAAYTGRILDMQITNDGNLLIAAASGGLWKVTGSSASPLSDAIQDLAVSTVAADPGNNNNIYIGTGEPYVRGGSGLYFTNNGGSNWSSVSGFSPTPAGIYKIRYWPGHPDEIHVAATNGYYRSADGGATWSKNLTGNICDFTFTDENTQGWMFCAAWGVNKIYWSTLFGALWNEITLPFTNVGRVALAYQSGTLYAAIARLDNYNLHGVYKSTDFGSNWTNISPPENYMGNQGWYDNIIQSPAPNLIYVGGVDLWKTTDDGSSWTKLSGANIHSDQHAIAHNWNSELFIGNDGGLSKSPDEGATWSTSLNKIPITQYVNVDVFSGSVAYIAGGSQDNGISVTTNLGNTWTYALGGDGGGVAFDPDDRAKMFVTNGVYGGDWTFRRHRTADEGNNWQDINNGIDPSDQWYNRIRNDQVSPIYLFNNSGPYVYQSNDDGDNWTKLNSTPFASDISDITVAKWSSSGQTIVYATMPETTGTRLWVYSNGTWYNDHVPADLPTDVQIRKVTPHPEDPFTAFIIMNGISQTGPSKKIYKTTDLGVSWTNITGNLPNIPFSDVVAHPTNSSILIASSELGCFKTTDGGASWVRWNDGMPYATIITELRYVNEINTTGKLYLVAGTYGRGIYVRELNDGSITDVKKDQNIPAEYSLTQNYPNPFNPSTLISFSLPVRDKVNIKVYDIQGREVTTLVNSTLDAGSHAVQFSGKGLASGVYIYRIQTSRFSQSKKMTLLK